MKYVLTPLLYFLICCPAYVVATLAASDFMLFPKIGRSGEETRACLDIAFFVKSNIPVFPPFSGLILDSAVSTGNDSWGRGRGAARDFFALLRLKEMISSFIAFSQARTIWVQEGSRADASKF